MPEKGPVQYFPVPEDENPQEQLVPTEDERVQMTEGFQRDINFVPPRKRIITSPEEMYRQEEPAPLPQKTEAELKEQKEGISRAIDAFYATVDEAQKASPAKTISFRFTDEHGPAFRMAFRKLVMKYKEGISGVEIFSDNIATADAYHFVRLDRRKYN